MDFTVIDNSRAIGRREGELSFTRLLRIMKLTVLIMFIACMQVHANGYGQAISLSETHAPLNEVFRKIEKQSGYLFWYNNALLKSARTVDINVKNASLQQVLDICFRDQPFTYEIVDKMVVLKTKPVEALTAVENPNPQIDIHGKVTDSLGNPLAGASVTIKGTNKGTKTNAKGEFDMKDVRSNMILVISYTGYASKEVSLSSDMSQAFIVLQRSQDILDATVIQAYGTTSRRFSVGSISTVDASTIEKQPVSNVLLALEGQAPGLAINATSGVPGSRVQLQIRGQNTITADPANSPVLSLKPYTQPLFIVDGVPFAAQNANISQLSNMAMSQSVNGGINQAGGLSPFANINPNDIESISILKDADATSIYGTQGSNGVILITTKKGKVGKTDFDLTANTGFNFTARLIQLMNTQQYTQMRKDAFAADGITPSGDPNNYAGYAPDLLIFDQNKYTNWEKVINGKTSHNTDIHGSISGGNSNNTFIISGGFTRNDYNFPQSSSFADQRLTLHSNIHHASADNRFSIDLGMDYGYDVNNSPGFGGPKVLLPPNTPDLLDSAGNLIWTYKNVVLFNYQFYSYLKEFDKTQNYNMNDVLRLSYKILPGLSLTANAGYSRNNTNEHLTNPKAAQYPLFASGSAQFATNDYETINIEPQLDYNTKIGKGMFSGLIGATYKKNLNYNNTILGSNYADDAFLGSIDGAASVSSNDASSIYRYSAAFARLKYVYDQKYIISLSGRRDGSSNFGPGRQFGDFGSVGAGWIFSEEKPFKLALPFISYGKLTGSYGTSGSDGVQPYLYQPYWQAVGYISPFQGTQPTVPTNLYNPNFSWALKKSLNLALDLGFMHDRILVNATYYRDREGNQLGAYPLGAQAGFPGGVLKNLPATVQNKGWEFSVTASPVKTKDFSWSVNFNLSFNRNKLLALPNLASSPYASQYVLGKPVSEVIGYVFTGLNPTTGLYQFRTANGHDTTSPNYGTIAKGGDQVPIADREVKYMGGFGNTFTYKGFSFYVFFQFSSQMAPNWLQTIYSSSYFPGPGGQIYNMPTAALNYWKKPGDNTLLQKLSTAYSGETANAASAFGQSTGAYSDDTYFRLKTAAVSYSLPAKWTKRAGIHDCRIFVNAQNLLTFTDYKVTDPEQFNDFTVTPLQRTVVFGLNFNF